MVCLSCSNVTLTFVLNSLNSIDQLDKADSPPIPDSYIYLLGLQSIISLCDGFASTTLPLFNTIVVQRPRVPGETVVRAPPSLDVSTLPPDQTSTAQLKAIHGMVESGWPALLAGLSFVVATNLSEELFADVLESFGLGTVDAWSWLGDGLAHKMGEHE